MSVFHINRLLAPRGYGYNYTTIPEEYQNNEFYHAAVKAGVNPYLLPEKYDLFLEAVKIGFSPKSVPSKFRDATMCKAYVQNCASPDLSDFKQSVLNSSGLWMELVRMNYKVATQVPKSQVTQELVNFTVSQDGSLLGSFQKKHRLMSTCLTAIRSPGWNDSCVADIPPEHRDKEVCKAFMEKANDVSLAIDYIPTALRSEQCLRFYARRDGNIIPKFPKRLWTNQIWEMGVESFATRQFQWSKDFMEFCPEELKTPIYAAIEEDRLEKERVERTRLQAIEDARLERELVERLRLQVLDLQRREQREAEQKRIESLRVETFKALLLSNIGKAALISRADNEEEQALVKAHLTKAGPEFRTEEVDDPITMEPLQEGEIYAFFTLKKDDSVKKFFAGSLLMFQTFISMGQNGSTTEKVLVPLMNKLTPTSELEWFIW